ncbi:MAG: ECF-type sigma factor [Planctomycetaceae bacterium]
MSSESQSSVSKWLQQLKEDNAQAAQKLWGRFFSRLVKLAETHSRSLAKGAVDGEDIAASVMRSLWRGARAGRLDDVKTRDELWWLLLALTRRKLVSSHRMHTAIKRGGHVAHVPLDYDRGRGYRFDDLVSDEPSPDYAIALEDEFSRLLNLLRDDKLRQIAVLKIEGYSNGEIRDRLEVSDSTVLRKLKLIRSTWAREIER